MAKNKFYVVWQGRVNGIFDNWNDCNAQVSGFENAKYKSFETKTEAEKAYTDGYKKYYKNNASTAKSSSVLFSGSNPDAKPNFKKT